MTIERHSRARKIELGQQLLGRRKVYLDTRYWIILRETAAARRTDAASRKLLHFLRRGVNAGRLICPISADLFMELTKQANTPTRRQATARLIDELSLGVTSMDPQTLLATEVHRFLSAALHGQEAVHPMQELIWTKVAYALGDMYPKLDSLPPEDQLKVQKRVFDHLWEMPLSDLMAGMDDGAELRRDYTELTRDTNARNQEHRDELRSYENAYDVELRGAVEVVGEIAADIIAEMEARTTGSRPDPSAEQHAASVNMCRNLVYHAMRRPENRSAMRTLHVKASIHAAMRWDKERRFKANDWHDFGHATIALTYCDAFLTEGPLRHLVTSSPPADPAWGISTAAAWRPPPMTRWRSCVKFSKTADDRRGVAARRRYLNEEALMTPQRPKAARLPSTSFDMGLRRRGSELLHRSARICTRYLSSAVQSMVPATYWSNGRSSVMQFLAASIMTAALCTAGIVSASSPSETKQPSMRAKRAYNQLLSGKVAGREESCFNTRFSYPRLSVYGKKLLYRVNEKLVYVTETSGGCEGISFGDTLQTYPYKAKLCKGDIAHTIRVPSRVPSGSCTIGSFVPYRSY